MDKRIVTNRAGMHKTSAKVHVHENFNHQLIDSSSLILFNDEKFGA